MEFDYEPEGVYEGLENDWIEDSSEVEEVQDYGNPYELDDPALP